MPSWRKKRADAPAATVIKRAEPTPDSHGLSLTRQYQGLPETPYEIAWSADGTFLAAGGAEPVDSAGGRRGKVVCWEVATGRQRVVHQDSQSEPVYALAWHPARPLLAFGKSDGRVQISNVADGDSIFLSRARAGESKQVGGVAWSPDGSKLVVTQDVEHDQGDGSIGIWDVQTQTLLWEVHGVNYFNAPCWSPGGQTILAPRKDGFINVHSAADLGRIRQFRASDDVIHYLDISPDGRLAATSLLRGSVLIWDPVKGKEIVRLESQGRDSHCVKFSPDGNFLVSKGDAVELWRCRDWELVSTIPIKNASAIGGLAFHPSQPVLAVKDRSSGQICCYTIDHAALGGASVRPDSRRYVNAKVVLLGDTGVGKSGLGLVLSGQEYQPTDSTHGRRVWTFDSQEVEVPPSGKQTREVLLWDLAGQPATGWCISCT